MVGDIGSVVFSKCGIKSIIWDLRKSETRSKRRRAGSYLKKDHAVDLLEIEKNLADRVE